MLVKPQNAVWKSRWAGLIPMAAAFAAMAWISWRRWPELLIDFGRQLYVPWQLSEGQTLYRDIAYLPGGPFSQYFNALLFKIFGVSFNTLIAANLIFVASLACGLYALFIRVCDRLTATLLGLAFVIGFAFPQYFEIGNYNYISPYSHEVVHGLFFAILLLVGLSQWLKNGGLKSLFGSALCFGLIFLTKPEIFLAAAAVVATAFFLHWKKRPDQSGKSGLIFLGASGLPPLLFFLCFLSQRTAGESLRAVSAAWGPLLSSPVTDNYYYRWCLGLDLPWARTKAMFRQFLQASGLILFLWFRCRSQKAWFLEQWWLAGLGCAIAWSFDWTHAGRSLPLFCLSTLVIFLWHHRKTEHHTAGFSFLCSG